MAKKAQCQLRDIQNFCIWGNHSPTMFADLTNAKINGNDALTVLQNVNPSEDIHKWYNEEYIPCVGKRGAAIIEARGLSSAASAANACLAHKIDWELNVDENWRSMAICNNVQYGISKRLFFSYPVVCHND
eukprot:UN08078